MKLRHRLFLFIALLFSLSISAEAQLNVGSPVQISNTVNFATFTSNQVSVVFPQVTAFITGVTNSATTFTGSYTATLTNATGSNIVITATITSPLTAGVNTNITIPPVAINIPVFMQYQAQANGIFTYNLQVH
jgi:YbbR domain-containing protein